MSSREPFWKELFGAVEGNEEFVKVQMCVLMRNGRPLLLLPKVARAASRTLELYPAQTALAQLARAFVRWTSLLSLNMGFPQVEVSLSPAKPFVKYLFDLAGKGPGQIPIFGVLAGNPRSEAQRFLILLFDSGKQPVYVVKVGMSSDARTLVASESQFLASIPVGTKAVPDLGRAFHSAQREAFALRFVSGDSPDSNDLASLSELLGSWVDENVSCSLGELNIWSALSKAAAGNPLFGRLHPGLYRQIIHPVLYHGDLAAWNIKVASDGQWTVLDWERGALVGMPGWDWFHYVLQPALLVKRRKLSAVINITEEMFRAPAFQAYAIRTRIAGFEKELFLAYLLYQLEVIKPSEGLFETAELLELLSNCWACAKVN